MDIKLHALAKTTPAIRKYIQESNKSINALAKELNLSTQTVHKWRHNKTIYDGSHARGRLATEMSLEEEEIIVELRTKLLLSLDDITEVVKRCVRSTLSRSAVHRCLARRKISRFKKEDKQMSQTFEQATCGFIHIDLKVLSPLNKKRSYVFVAIDRATRFVVVEIIYKRDAETTNACLERFLKVFPYKVHTILTDNDGAFTDRFAVSKIGKPPGKPSGGHLFDLTCQKHKIEHRLIKPHHPQTNGMVERFNRRLSEVLQKKESISRNTGKNKFFTHEERNAYINTFVANYNKTRLKCLNYKAPTEVLNNQRGLNTQAGIQKSLAVKRRPHMAAYQPTVLLVMPHNDSFLAAESQKQGACKNEAACRSVGQAQRTHGPPPRPTPR